MALIVKNNLKKYVDLNIGTEFAREFEKKVEEMLKAAEKRAKENGRRTIYERDL
jgi:histone H3/H4